jgi:hypothetical protein
MPDTVVSPPAPSPAPVIDCAAYCGGSRVADLGIDQIRPALSRDDQFVWLGLYEPEQDVLRQVQKQFGLHDLAIEDAYNAHQRPKLELYEDSLLWCSAPRTCPPRRVIWSSARRTSFSDATTS